MKQVFKEVKVAFGLLKMIHSLDQNIIPIYLMAAVMKASEPFVTIIGSSYIIDSLLNEQWRQAMVQTSVMILTVTVVGVLSSYLQKILEGKSMTINRLCNSKILLKAISLDYATFEDKKNLEEFQAADYNVSRNGGFGMYMLSFFNFLTGIIGFFVSLGVILELCVKEVKAEGILGIVVSTTGSFILVGFLIIILIILYARLSLSMKEKNVKMYYELMDVNQKTEYLSRNLPLDMNIAKEIRLYGMKDMIYSEWKKLSIEIYAFYQKYWNSERRFLVFTSMLSDVALLLGYLFVVVKTYVGAVSIGFFTKYVGAIKTMNSSLRATIESLNQILLYQSYLSFYTTFLEKENKLDTGSLPVEKRKDNEYEFEFHNVSFRYPGSEEETLKNVSLKLDLKKRFAVVGRNGAGKTTFVKLLCRMYDVTEGSITLNGVDIRKYDYKEYLNLFAAVFQDFSLFSIPVKDNIACNGNADETKVWKSLESAGIKERIDKMPKKLDNLLYHEMGDGEDVSGGEAQKIAIARALYKDAPFVILDEPTAALDPISEYEIYSRFDGMVRDKTSIYISHRMSSCRFCDDILVFDKGMLIQRGNHDDLIKEHGKVYERLWHAQAKYYADPVMEEEYTL
ncbi:ABC transporter ATP-binding protein [Anaeromicropila herbilytica]|uniref:ABC transporter ATP-binding protein n=1 Tax=Anaeromicropila herbilytica TaxID=2785025 RepID=A0A7R7IEC2_9FIRM|nr:ABC transporter ATP-binding protein [Anaeromicropila herbilytica]BCN31836.1 ABC transporter ATP-binding protein [Anaeromicropila herbilytica]